MHTLLGVYPCCSIALGFSGETEPIEYGGCNIEIYCEGLSHVIIEAEQSQDLPSAHWRPKKASLGGGEESLLGFG